MVDVTKSTGSTGTMRIRDTGSRIEFWLKAGSATFNYQLPWGYTVNGVTDNSNSFRFEKGGAWQLLKSWTVSTSQTVTFRLQDSGTSGLGGPTTLTMVVDRSVAPSAPSKPTASSITASSVRLQFSDGANGGAAIDERQLGRSSSTSAPSVTYSSDRDTTISSLASGTTYYFRARTHNKNGWSAWGPYVVVTTLDEPDKPGIVTVTDITQNSVMVTFKDANTGGAPILERQVGYTRTSGGTPTTTVKYSGKTKISGLLAGTTYYFRSRTRNSVGWSAWSAQKAATTLAGAYVRVGGVWKPAVPYVRVGGVWKIARPYVKVTGTWKES